MYLLITWDIDYPNWGHAKHKDGGTWSWMTFCQQITCSCGVVWWLVAWMSCSATLQDANKMQTPLSTLTMYVCTSSIGGTFMKMDEHLCNTFQLSRVILPVDLWLIIKANSNNPRIDDSCEQDWPIDETKLGNTGVQVTWKFWKDKSDGYHRLHLGWARLQPILLPCHLIMNINFVEQVKFNSVIHEIGWT